MGLEYFITPLRDDAESEPETGCSPLFFLKVSSVFFLLPQRVFFYEFLTGFVDHVRFKAPTGLDWIFFQSKKTKENKRF